MTTTANKAVVRRLYTEAFNNRQLHLIDELVAENFVDHNPDPGQEPNRSALAPMILGFWEAFPDMTMTVQTMVAEGDRVGTQMLMEGTHLGAFAGAPATGRKVRISGFDWCRVENGKIAERWGVFDMAGMMQQIGLAPSPTPEELKKLSNRYYEILDGAKGDMATIRSELFHPQVVNHFVGQPPLNAEALQGLVQVFFKAFPDLEHKVTSQICEGDTVLNQLKVTGTHKAELNGIPATNKTVEVDLMTSQRWVDGKLVEQHIYPDMVSLLIQIGAIEAPTA